MSRKDPRRTLRVPLSAAALDALRAARGRSLADALRRRAEAHAGPVPRPGHPVRRLPLQLPKRLRARIEALADETGRSPEDLLAGIAEAAQGPRD
ncbi:hypothetical protein [Roseivivax sediminis]|uniref:Uncharacterized protein n=1 Tax=Roseivivax sediminis TaxID=936889 RepID=A0A1I1W131_9RHOB|nr:hypothetical protein [Roseivivax sediminis]SFD88825.1 hypothetical protein SAMN04515678_10468 [Roseivivax sediminis]